MNDSNFLHFLLLVLLLIPTHASAPGNSDEELILHSMRLDNLQRKIRTLEDALYQANFRDNIQGTKGQPTESENLKERIEELEENQEIQMEELESLDQKLDLQVHFNGYFDLKAVDYKARGDQRKDSFDQHHTALFIDIRKGRTQFFAEMEWEHAGKSLKQERAWVRYESGFGLNLKAGHFFAPTHWNLNHYPTIALSISEPDFSRRYFPRSLSGLDLSKTWIRGHSSLSYETYFANGFEEDPILVGRDVNDSKAIGHRIRFERIKGDRSYAIALHHYRDRRSNDLLNQPIGADGKYVSKMIEGEFNHGNLGLIGALVTGTWKDPIRVSGLLRSNSWYIQPALRLSSKITSYARFGVLDPDRSIQDPLDRQQQVYGLNIKPTFATTWKLEWIQHRHTLKTNIDDKQLWSSLSFAF